jgi:WD40 repeat protein
VSIDFTQQLKGHLNVRTIKEVNFFGPFSQYIVSGSDDGRVFIWEKRSGKLVQLIDGDSTIANCVQGHPQGDPTLAVSGIDNDIKVFMPTAKAACSLVEADQVVNGNIYTVPPHHRQPFLPLTPLCMKLEHGEAAHHASMTLGLMALHLTQERQRQLVATRQRCLIC